MSRSQIALRALVLLGPVVAVLATGPAGNWPPWWIAGAVAAAAAAAAWDPDAPYGTGAGLGVLGWWAIALEDSLPASILVAALALVTAHVAGVLASYGPSTMPIDAATVALWVRRGALVLVTVPAAWVLALLLRGEPEQPGIWLLGALAAFVATAAATAALAVRAAED
ncbi:hypothetical protein [Nocardioides sp. SR21]|uniref:hypothetical protein n=1 Tax=Nocardioides sp. SR21 TaxID=2919501 RepID=UPI001FAA153F|nr:hypothetical protein [Nocardioides sp. SR21]